MEARWVRRIAGIAVIAFSSVFFYVASIQVESHPGIPVLGYITPYGWVAIVGVMVLILGFMLIASSWWKPLPTVPSKETSVSSQGNRPNDGFAPHEVSYNRQDESSVSAERGRSEVVGSIQQAAKDPIETKLTAFRSLKDKGLISEQDYKEKKRELLKNL